MALKYESILSSLNFSFDGFSERQRIAFRWVFEDITHKDNFKPKYAIDPKFIDDNPKGWGLSFFDTHDKAKKRIEEITKDKPNLFKKLGTHIAVGNLEFSDGISNDSDRKGHFTHFDYEKVELCPKFKIIEKIA